MKKGEKLSFDEQVEYVEQYYDGGLEKFLEDIRSKKKGNRLNGDVLSIILLFSANEVILNAFIVCKEWKNYIFGSAFLWNKLLEYRWKIKQPAEGDFSLGDIRKYAITRLNAEIKEKELGLEKKVNDVKVLFSDGSMYEDRFQIFKPSEENTETTTTTTTTITTVQYQRFEINLNSGYNNDVIAFYLNLSFFIWDDHRLIEPIRIDTKMNIRVNYINNYAKLFIDIKLNGEKLVFCDFEHSPNQREQQQQQQQCNNNYCIEFNRKLISQKFPKYYYEEMKRKLEEKANSFSSLDERLERSCEIVFALSDGVMKSGVVDSSVGLFCWDGAESQGTWNNNPLQQNAGDWNNFRSNTSYNYTQQQQQSNQNPGDWNNFESNTQQQQSTSNQNPIDDWYNNNPNWSGAESQGNWSNWNNNNNPKNTHSVVQQQQQQSNQKRLPSRVEKERICDFFDVLEYLLMKRYYSGLCIEPFKTCVSVMTNSIEIPIRIQIL